MSGPKRIVSGGQAGVDRAGLDWAIARGIPHGGWCPAGRIAEDGTIPERYQLRETASPGYRERTRRNVEDSDGTLILNLGELDGGTLATQQFAESLGKPCLVIALDGPAGAEVRVLDWLKAERIETLNVAGPRESKRPGIHGAALAFLTSLGPA